ncbi:hypothetical protein [Nostoc sp. T09]|nr:hypothetical protein [Nostoc sp. T09]
MSQESREATASLGFHVTSYNRNPAPQVEQVAFNGQETMDF